MQNLVHAANCRPLARPQVNECLLFPSADIEWCHVGVGEDGYVLAVVIIGMANPSGRACVLCFHFMRGRGGAPADNPKAKNSM
jgi:hypothetical protein